MSAPDDDFTALAPRSEALRPIAQDGPHGSAQVDMDTAPEVDGDDVPVVGIGASAGGLESLERLFSHMPQLSGMAFVVVQHLSPDFRSVMDEILARHTPIPIRQAADGMRVQRDTIYLLPPGKEMIIRQRQLRLVDKDPRGGLSLPIDQFFRSLAQDLGPRALAVVLSGSGSDGSRGLLEIKRAGGMVLAESEISAKFDGMPLAAQNTGVVDHVLRPEEMPAVLCREVAARHPHLEGVPAPDGDGDERRIQAIFRLLRDDCGIDFSHYKTTTVRRRIERRLALQRLEDLDEYLERLRQDPGEVSSLYEDLLIGVTRFFRDHEAFAAIERRVVPNLLERVAAHEDVRVWVPGCATGEEAYSLAILLYEQLTARERPVNLKIFATDVHRRSLEIAGAGVYGEDQVAEVGPERLARFFNKRPEGYQVSQELRQHIVFAHHNVLKDAPFTKLDLISCRNLLIYLQPHAQRAVLTLFHFGLKTGGALFLGSSESLGFLSDEFECVGEHWKVYRKRREARLADMKLPLLRGPAPPANGGGTLTRGSSQRPDGALLATYDRLLDRFMPPSFLIDEERNLLDTFGGAEAFLRVKGRRPSQNLLDLLDDDLRPVIAGLVQRGLKEDASVRRVAATVRGEGGVRRVDVQLEPILNPRAASRHLLVSVFDQPVPVPAAAALPRDGEGQSPPPLDPDELTRDRIKALESELSYTKESLQSTIEELEAANEELQATNEELVASNEELQSTNEELHSVNEELYTVNAEHQKKIVELQEASTDVHHLLERTGVGTLFLDRELRVRKFTLRMAELFRFLPRDVGRKLSDFSHAIQRPGLMEEVARSLEQDVLIEEEVRDDAGTYFLLRILPYHAEPPGERREGNGTGRRRGIEGVLLTLTDISILQQARTRLGQLSAIVESSDDAIVGRSLDGLITTWNRGAERLYGYAADEAVGRSMAFLVPPDRREEEDGFLAQIRRGEPVHHVETVRAHKDGRRIDVSMTVSPIRNGGNEIVGVSFIARDITALVGTRRQVEEREQHIRLLLESTAEAIFGVDMDGKCTFCNPACARLLGHGTATDLIGKNMHAVMHHTRPDGSAYPEDACPIVRALRDGRGTHAEDELFWRNDHTSFPVEYWSRPIERQGSIVGAVITFNDITERKRSEEEIHAAARRRERFLATLSHELRNPLSAVRNATRLLALPAAGPDAMARARGVLERQASHMARLLDDLLDVSRITRGGVPLRPRLVDLRDTARAALEAVGPLLEERGTRLTVNLTEAPLWVHGDPDRLQQIQVNLLGNAATYSPEGAPVLLTLARAGEDAVIRVKDEGLGIAPQILPRIFEPFMLSDMQSEERLDRPRGGLGLGLSLVKSLVTLHGGRVQAFSDGPGRGSEFVVNLPLETPAAAAEAVADRPAEARRGRTVAIVEDQSDLREVLRLLLESIGHRVVEAADGQRGVEAILEMNPDVALVDIGLPVIDGYEVARRLRAVSGTRTVLVALTGYGQAADVEAARQAGFDRHLTKPVDPELLERLLATL